MTTCRETYQWLLADETPGGLPSEVRRHVLGCPRCQARRQELARLNLGLREQPGPAADPAALARALQALDA